MTLQDGEPQQGFVKINAFVFYQLQLPAGPHDLAISLTPVAGLCYMYAINSWCGNQPCLPTPTM